MSLKASSAENSRVAAISTLPPWPLPCIDAMRGVAALLVVVHHFGQQELELRANVTGHLVSDTGWIGVTIFFIISGFCIHGATLHNQTKGRPLVWSDYFKRRFFRIYPGFVCALLISLAVAHFHESALIRRPSFAALAKHLFLLSGFDSYDRCSINAVLWTVVLECQFYFLYPAYLWLRRRCSQGTTIGLIMGAGFAYFAAVTVATSAGDIRVMWQFTFPALWWQWCLGAVAAEWYFDRTWERLGSARQWLAAGAAALVLFTIPAFVPEAVGLQFKRFAFPWLSAVLVLSLCRSVVREAAIPFLSWAGKVSYSIYLFHPLVLVTLFAFPTMPEAMKGMVTLGGTLAIAWCGYQFVEHPFMKMRGGSTLIQMVNRTKTAL